MAVDTPLKRASCFGFMQPTRSVLSPPQGASTTGQRAMGDRMYSGISALEAGAGVLPRTGTLHQSAPKIWKHFNYPGVS